MCTHGAPVPVVHVVELVEDHREDVLQLAGLLAVVEHVPEHLGGHHSHLRHVHAHDVGVGTGSVESQVDR